MNSNVIDIHKIKETITNTALEEVLKNSTSDTEREIKRDELKAKIDVNTLITDVQSIGDSIEPENLNKVFNELYIDTLTTFGVLNSLNEASSRYKASYKGNIDMIKSKINTVKSKLNSCRNSINNMQMPFFHLEDFKATDSFDKTRSIQKDRYGQYLPSNSYVRQLEDGGIGLPIVRRDNSLRYDNKVHTGKVLINFQLGRGFIDGGIEETSTENIIDDSDMSFWNDNILSDAPFEVSFKETKPEKLYTNDGYYYGVENGALCELEINFESVNTINEISLNPYVKYPINIIAIRYKLTEDQDEEITELVTPDNIDKTLRGRIIDGVTTYRFPDILCKKIYIVFTQEHYERKTYIYKRNDIYKNAEWFNSKNNKLDKNINADFKANYKRRENNTTVWDNINNKILDSNSDDISEIILYEDNDIRKIIKYEYQYGFYNIGCFNNHFDRTGFYISKPIRLNANIKSVKINTNEEHSKNNMGNHVTDIEYYVACSENPDTSEWIPIIPENKKVIESELLFITSETRAYLRFQTDHVIAVMKNGEAIPEDSNEYHLDIDDRTGKIYCVQIFNYDFDAIYSISYVPEGGHNIIDFSNKITASIETFKGNDNNSFTLKNNVLTDNKEEYCSVKLMDMSVNASDKEIEVENVTDLSSPGNSFLNFDETLNKFQFYINENKIYFNKPIPSTCMIDISYKHLINSIRIKAFFRRNTTKDVWLTPILKEIEYNIETI